jgi:phosphohistidine phosphatase
MLDSRPREIDAERIRMRRLILLRHAKSDWSRPGQADHDRALSARGRKAAPRIGAYLAEQGLVPDLVLASTALRVRETLDPVLKALGRRPRVTFDRRLYEADADDILGVLRETSPAAPALLVVGHNPGLSDLAELLVASGSDEAQRAMLEKFPSAGLAVIDFAVDDWRDLKPGSGRLDRFVTPRSLGAPGD